MSDETTDGAGPHTEAMITATEPGWYFYWNDYPDEGSDGPYASEQECREFAECAAEDACDRADGEEPPEFTVWELKP